MNCRVPVALVGLLLVVPSLLGCQALRERTDALKDSSSDLFKWHRKEGTKELDRPERIVAIWSESTVFGPNQKPVRGLGGRLYFYNRNHQPVKATGSLVVYGFHDGDDAMDVDAEELTSADRKFVFTEEEFERYFSPSEFGPSYSVWLPWDAAGGEKKAISVVPVFKSTEGLAIVGDHSRTTLPGRDAAQLARAKRRRASATSQEDESVQHASFTRQNAKRTASVSRLDVAEDDDAHRTSEAGDYDNSTDFESEEDLADERTDPNHSGNFIQTTTIRVPPSLKQRILEATESDAKPMTPRSTQRRRQMDKFEEIPLGDQRRADNELTAEEFESAAAEQSRSSTRPGRQSALRRERHESRRTASRYVRPRAAVGDLAKERRMQQRTPLSTHREPSSHQVPTSPIE